MNIIGPYIPILRPKEGELKALKNLSDHTISKITPFFDFHRPPIVNKKRKPFFNHIEDTCRKITKHWKKDELFFFDLYFIDLKERMDELHPILWISNFFIAEGYSFIPIIGTERDEAYFEALREIVACNKESGICVRLFKR